MKYLNYINDEIKEYYMILCDNDYPEFIDKYINTKDLRRLEGIGHFCGCDYTGLFNMKFWYSRLHHSIACALMMWKFTKDKNQTLAALFHDLGTPSFSHCIDFLLNDPINQESSELSVKDILNKSLEINKLLKEDNINIEDINDVSKYTIMENKKPKICVDRLEGIFCTGLVWAKFWNIKDVDKIYRKIIVLKDEDDKDEIGFKGKTIAEFFYSGSYKYSIILQQNEDKFTLKYISDVLKELIDNNIILKKDLYNLSEKQIINKIKSSILTNEKWKILEELKGISRSDNKPKNKYYVSTEIKKKYVMPLVVYKKQIFRLEFVSQKCQVLIKKYLAYKDSLYSYIKEEL